jgi:hypothetical protein
MFTITELSTERINSILTEALAFANGKTAKIEGEVFAQTFSSKTAQERKQVLILQKEN